MNQRGFIQLAPMMWAAIAACAVIAGLSGAVWVQTMRLDAEKAEFATFKGGVEALGLAAKDAADKKKAADRKRKEDADAENKRLAANLAIALKRLRDERAGSGFVPPAAAGSASPDRATFERAELERAIRSLDSGVQGLVDEGSAATLSLDTAKRWARQ